MSNFKFSLNGITSFVQQRIGNNYSSVSTLDSHDRIRERMREKPNRNKKSNHTDTINTLCLIRSGMVLSGSRDSKIALTNVDNGDLALFWDTHGAEVTKLAYRNSVAKHSVFSGSRDSTITMYHLNNPTPLRVYNDHRLTITGVANIDDESFISGSRDTSIKIWDVETGKVRMQKEMNRNLVTHLAYNPNLSIIAQSSEDKTVKLFDPRSLAVIHEYPRKQHIQMHCDFMENTHVLVSCSNGFNNDGGEVTLYDLRYAKPIKELRGHEGSVTCVTTVPIGDNKKIIVSTGADKTIRVWRFEDMSLSWTEESPFEMDMMQCCAYAEGHVIVSGGHGRLAHYQARMHGSRVALELLWVQSSQISESISNQTF
ncbi:unnamed protein product [Caenorhabditis bovis]|uniref:WD repeat-containing protein 55 homolog n=1 Tax=Caenorhabditis bovis TaxID=2654633 RepID=A0A8S1EUV8_9PELO|nr:unnamed protein product [Caenorhabditis bovis]